MSRSATALLLVLLGAGPAAAQGAKTTAPPPVAPDNYEAVYQKYLAQARAASPAATSFDWMNGLALDHRARSVNDLITIRVIESISASGTADSSLNKSGSGAVALPGLFGLEKALGPLNPASLVGAKTSTDFKGGGATNRAGDLSAIVTARVAEVLPNGDLVIEGVREMDINGDRQIVVLTGVARAVDVNPENTILSTEIGQLQIRYFGKGLIKDNLSPGWLVRFLNKVF